MRSIIAAVLTCALAAVAPHSAAAQGAKTVNVIIFPGGFNLPTWAAMAQGYFGREGIEVKLTPTPNSVFQMTNLIAGKFDVAMTALDNVIAYQEGQAPVKLETTPDLFVFLASDTGFLSLIVQPSVRSFADLKGKELAVDAVGTGFAFVLREMLRRNGLGEADYRFVPMGGGKQRYDAMVEGKALATLNVSPFDILAEAKGLKVLARAKETIGPYLGVVAAARRSWAAANEREVVGYIRAYKAGVAWLYEPANRGAAIDLLIANSPGMDRALAEKSVATLLHPTEGFFRDPAIDPAGAQTVMELRSRYAEPKKTLTDAARYYDLSFYEKAKR